MYKSWQIVLSSIFLACLFGFLLHLCIRLDSLEQTLWGDSRAPEVVDLTLEITGSDYDHTETILALHPAHAPLIRRVFDDDVITCAEYEEVRSADYALRRHERSERSVDDAKADLRKALKQQASVK